MEEIKSFESTNINAKWLDNIYENLKNLEMLERIAREGCQSLMDYLEIPYADRHIIVADTRYKNLRFIVTEMGLLLTDLEPVIDEKRITMFRSNLNSVDKIIEVRKLFLKEIYSATSNNIIESRITPFFENTLRFLCLLRSEIIHEISDILYVKVKNQEGTKPWTNKT